ncbi:glycosyltransferase family 4 protein [Candidatus Gracilibacteria bacterium]|nr:glycosyltransferase family 4 protein [Candidatus Gracilibacteria bacterium]
MSSLWRNPHQRDVAAITRRIAFLDSWLQQTVAGSGTAAAIGGLGQALVEQGHRVSRIAPHFQRPRDLTARRLLFNVQLPALLASLDYDLLVGFDIDGFLLSLLGSRKPYVCSIKGVIAEELLNESGSIRHQLWRLSLLEGINARRAPLVVTTSEYCRRAIAQHYAVDAAKIRIVPEGIDLRRWLAFDARFARRDEAAILCVARQYPRKHIADLLHAFAILRTPVPQASLVIIGDGPEHQNLRQLAQDLGIAAQTRFLGGLPDDNDVLAWYHRCAVFCLPSVQEGFGIVFLEAMAAGLPIVSTSAAAIPEVVPDGEAGILVEPAAPIALADALTKLLTNAPLRARYSDFARNYVAQYDWQQVAQQFLRAIAQPGDGYN